MHGTHDFLGSPQTRDAVVSFAIVIAHACAGAGATLVAADPMARDRSWRTADRFLLFVAFALGLPSIAFASLSLAASSRDAVLAAREAFGPLLVSAAAMPILWLGAWAARALATSNRLARIAGWLSVIAAVLGVVTASVIAAWYWAPSEWIDTRSLRSALLSPWIAPALLLRGAVAIAVGSAAVWAWDARRVDSGAVRWPPTTTWLAAAVAAIALAVLCLALAEGFARDPWTGVPALSGPHGSRTRRLVFVALSALACATAIASWAARAAPRHRFAPAGAAALFFIGSLCFEQARPTSIRPWALPGLLYANGTTVERVRVQRRSPRLDPPAGASKDALGEAMCRLQCSACHDAQGARARCAERGFPETRTLLEQLREADQAGSPWYGVMPPLVGSDEEIDSLARWICGRP